MINITKSQDVGTYYIVRVLSETERNEKGKLKEILCKEFLTLAEAEAFKLGYIAAK